MSRAQAVASASIAVRCRRGCERPRGLGERARQARGGARGGCEGERGFETRGLGMAERPPQHAPQAAGCTAAAPGQAKELRRGRSGRILPPRDFGRGGVRGSRAITWLLVRTRDEVAEPRCAMSFMASWAIRPPPAARGLASSISAHRLRAARRGGALQRWAHGPQKGVRPISRSATGNQVAAAIL